MFHSVPRPSLLLALALVLAGGFLLVPTPTLADEPPPGRDAPPGEGGDAVVEDVLPLVEVTGQDVNVRVGPRLDNRPVTTVTRGDVLLVVEEVPGWKGVLIPAGFPVAVSLDYVVPEGPNAVRVMARNLNLRVEPPVKGDPVPGIFRDHPALGQLLTLIDVEDPPADQDEASGEDAEGASEGEVRPFGHRWAWVVAPESIRAYVSDRFLRSVEPTPENLARVEAARERRRAEAAQLAEARQMALARASAMRLMETVGDVQRELHRLRAETASTDKAPIVALATRLEAALAEEKKAMPSVLRLAHALRDDLDREIALRVARHDAKLARELGRTPEELPPLAPKVEAIEARGIVRYEPTPGWKEEGVYFLWIDGKPTYVLRVDDAKVLRAVADGKEHAIEGALIGERVFGLPVLTPRRIQ